MASTIDTANSTEKQYQVPDWEHHNVVSETGSAARPRTWNKAALANKFNVVVPPHRKYLGLSRKIFLYVLLGLFLALLALIIGLAVGLSQSDGEDLPLPSNTEHFTGDLTYFQTGLGACGETTGQDDLIVSISHYVFDAAGSSSDAGGNSNENPLCGLMVRASRYDEEFGERRSVDLRVVDRCTGCEPEDLDTTTGAFEKLAPIADGRVDVTWAWLQPAATGR